MDGNLFRLEIFKSDSALSFPAFSIVGKLQYEMQSSDYQNGENDLGIEYIKLPFFTIIFNPKYCW